MIRVMLVVVAVLACNLLAHCLAADVSPENPDYVRVEMRGKLELARCKMFGHIAASVRVGDQRFWIDYGNIREAVDSGLADVQGKTVVLKGKLEFRNIGGAGECMAADQQPVIVATELKPA